MGSVVVFASGNGSNFQAIFDALQALPHRVAGLVCDVPGAAVLARAETCSVPSVLVPYTDGRRAAEERICRALDGWHPDLIALAGFMRILSPAFVDAHAGRVINVHPSLLPRYPGLHAIQRCYEAGDREAGITVHYVDRGVDTGRIIARKSLVRGEHQTLDELEARIHELEHATYPEVVLAILSRLPAPVAGARR